MLTKKYIGATGSNLTFNALLTNCSVFNILVNKCSSVHSLKFIIANTIIISIIMISKFVKDHFCYIVEFVDLTDLWIGNGASHLFI